MNDQLTDQQKQLRLEWIEAGSLDENPNNWRKHPDDQLSTLKDLIENPEIGWAAPLLYNERTKRLIDGHARRSVVSPDTLVPVLIGNWTEEAEKIILASLDPVGAMANGDQEIYHALTESVEADSLWVRELLHHTLSQTMPGSVDPDMDMAENIPDIDLPGMELQPFESYDYVMLMFKDTQNFQQACERFGLKKVQVKYPGGTKKVGVGRVLDGAQFLQNLSSYAKEQK